jgi:acyl-CoA-binding protein
VSQNENHQSNPKSETPDEDLHLDLKRHERTQGQARVGACVVPGARVDHLPVMELPRTEPLAAATFSDWLALPYEQKYAVASLWVDSTQPQPSATERTDSLLTDDARLALWALRQQMERGDNPEEKPGFWELTEGAKWSAWDSLRGTATIDAMRKFISILDEDLGPRWPLEHATKLVAKAAAGGLGEEATAAVATAVEPAGTPPAAAAPGAAAVSTSVDGQHRLLPVAAAAVVASGAGMWRVMAAGLAEGTERPPARCHHTTTLVGRKLLLMGGTGPHGVNHKLLHGWVYDLDRQRWSIARSEAAPDELAEPPPRAGHTATALPARRDRGGGGKSGVIDIVVFGGYNRQGLVGADNGALALASLTPDGSQLRWKLLKGEDSTGTAAAAPRVGHSAVGVRLNGRDCLVIFGGDASGHGGELLDDLRLVDFTEVDAPAWRALYAEEGPRPSARAEHTAVATERAMVVFGGMLATGQPTDELWILNWETWRWSLLAGTPSAGRAPCARVGHAMCLAPSGCFSSSSSIEGETQGRTLLIFGGGDGARGFGNLLALTLPRPGAPLLPGQSGVEWQELCPSGVEGGGLRPLEGSSLAAAFLPGPVPMALVCGGRGSTLGSGRYSTELYGWTLDGSAPGAGGAAGAAGEVVVAAEVFVSASSTALDFSWLPRPAGSSPCDGAMLSPRESAATVRASRAKAALEQSRGRDWTAAGQPEVVAEVLRLQRFLEGMIETAQSSPSHGGEVEGSSGGAAVVVAGSSEAAQQGEEGAEEEHIGWSVSKMLFG